MSSSTSSVPVVVDTFLQLLNDSDELLGVLVVDGPDDRDVERETVFVAPWVNEDAEQDWAAIAPAGTTRNRDESFYVVCVIVVTRPELAMKEARDRAYEILAVIETIVRSDPTLGLDRKLVPRVALTQSRPFPFKTDEGVGFQIVARVHVQTRI